MITKSFLMMILMPEFLEMKRVFFVQILTILYLMMLILINQNKHAYKRSITKLCFSLTDRHGYMKE